MYSFLSQKFKEYNSILDIYIYIQLFFYLRIVLSLIFLKFMLFGYDVVCNPIVLVVFLWSPVYRGSHVV